MQTEKPDTNGCGKGKGTLPGSCAPMVFPYVPVQERNPPRYNRTEALQTGTLFPGLNLPFKEAIISNMKMTNTALAELMALAILVLPKSFLTTTLYIFTAIGLLCLGLEIMIDKFLDDRISLAWSAVVVTVCVIIDITLITMLSHKRLRNAVRRRLHF